MGWRGGCQRPAGWPPHFDLLDLRRREVVVSARCSAQTPLGLDLSAPAGGVMTLVREAPPYEQQCRATPRGSFGGCSRAKGHEGDHRNEDGVRWKRPRPALRFTDTELIALFYVIGVGRESPFGFLSLSDVKAHLTRERRERLRNYLNQVACLVKLELLPVFEEIAASAAARRRRRRVGAKPTKTV